MANAKNEGNLLLSVMKGILVGVICTLLLVLVFALFVKAGNAGEGVITVINQIIKIVSIFIGCFFATKCGRRGFFVGIVTGLSITCINYLVFSIIAGDWRFTLSTGLDLIIACALGGLCGVILSGRRNKSR